MSHDRADAERGIKESRLKSSEESFGQYHHHHYRAALTRMSAYHKTIARVLYRRQHAAATAYLLHRWSVSRTNSDLSTGM